MSIPEPQSSAFGPRSSVLGPPSSLSFPKPYRAALAICSDLDETPDAETYFELMRFLNTTEETSMGPGVGLEVGNSIYFDMAPGHFSYWNTTEENRERIRILIRSGHIDVLHSYGDLAVTRAHAARALEELTRHGCRIKVWVDHAQAVTNFGSDIMQGHGDDPGHPAYHADLTMAYGIEYVWRGRVTSIVGQAAGSTAMGRRSVNGTGPDRNLVTSGLTFKGLAGIWDRMHPLESGRTMAKETSKQLLARCGSRKYRMHAPNCVLGSGTLRDGVEIQEFLRCNPHWGGVSRAARGDEIHEVLTDRFLDQLTSRGGVCILYTHMGKLERRTPRAFSPEVVAAFRRLAEYHGSGKILVATAHRLLGLCSGKSHPASKPGGAAPAWEPLAFPRI